ncbi:hypothetical protein 2 [Beihai picorna-like virus 2]|uniref:hypothetical protein 2 n=1 Tax=Beihai picorna-like virus 2 TaxID=1922562 RepID=UPI000909913F|nr:hypothetical protein 2 [Beihai picorna-like virus 2]APG76717.1 hypothetical protein 2 [Beihai picorna-like virus 2]APG76757.1 hypothetical protein 2 [Beihai picorna-like virus 2]APG76796.1 hypothetical protein 2 [Beihai picorna-like virus 2]APG76826.1 hypothetical protein 2 [Beihai picorna-like virus 2]APG76907.1 hypothetical protein 2 [Beihai picorna-like virus 2]
MRRFRNFRCNLKVKFVINGNPFYYGRALVSYNPYTFLDIVSVNRAFFIQDLIAASNKPHILLDPTTSEGGTIHCPFIWHYNYADITSANWTAELGEIIIHDFDALRHANGGTDPITVSVFAWCEDVDLCVPTTKNVQSKPAGTIQLDKFGYPDILDLQGQSTNKGKSRKKGSNKRSEDEFSHDGLISKPATAVAKAASYLSMVPYIGPYAKATEMVASKIGEVAKIFGYSRPQNISDVCQYTPRYTGNMVNTDTSENVTKLSIDSKNELTIDTRTFGLGGADEMTINSIAQRMTFWKQFDWAESKNPDDILASWQVQPRHFDTNPSFVGTEIHQTALSFASLPFEAWQGTIKYHFKVICSEYHRGRLRIVWDPKTPPTGAIPMNQTYSTIVDITENREFDYEVKWAQTRQWLNMPRVTTILTLPDNYYRTTSPCPVTEGNGTLSVYVLNELATPSITPSEIKIQVWTSAGDDFAVAIPGGELHNMSYWQEQSRPEMLASPNDNSNNPVGGGEIPSFADGAPSMESKSEQYLVYQGERILSFKDLLRRYWFSYVHLLRKAQPSSYGYTRITMPGLTPMRGFNLNRGRQFAQNSSAAMVRFDYAPMTLLNYLKPAFAVYRGSLRHKFVTRGWKNTSNESSMVISRRVLGPPHGYSVAAINADMDLPMTESAVVAALTSAEYSKGLGMVITPTLLNNTLEVETPFYSYGEKFKAARQIDHDLGDDRQGLILEIDNTDLNSDTQRRIDQYTSVGEDFTFGLFVGAPIIYQYNDPPPV